MQPRPILIHQRVFKVFSQKSILTQIRQLILYISNSKGKVDRFVGEVTPAQRLSKHIVRDKSGRPYAPNPKPQPPHWEVEREGKKRARKAGEARQPVREVQHSKLPLSSRLSTDRRGVCVYRTSLVFVY